MKKIITSLLVLMSLTRTYGQVSNSLTLEICHSLAAENYPLIKQRELIEKTKEYSISNASKGIFPMIVINGQQSVQSDVTTIPLQLPGIEVPTLSKNQYKVYADVITTLYDGGSIRNQKRSAGAQAKIDEQKLEVELYQLNDRVNQLYFGILMMGAQLKQIDLLKNDIQLGIRRTEVSIANGVSLKSDGDVLRAELLNTDQKTIEITSLRTAYLNMLGLLIGLTLTENTQLVRPENPMLVDDMSRPELKLFDYQYQSIDIQNATLKARHLPKLTSFLQVGYGRPGLNMLDNTADAYYISGFRLSWNLTGLYTFKNEKGKLNIDRSNIDLQKETFLFNTQYTLRLQSEEVRKLQTLLSTDDEIISLRSKIKSTASFQLENGVINTNDYLCEVSAEDQARQNKITHEIQLLLAQYTQQNTTGI